MKKAEKIIGVGTNNSHKAVWQSPDLPAPTILTGTDDEGKSGWILVERIIYVGYLSNKFIPKWRYPDLPAPTVLTEEDGEGGGWIVTKKELIKKAE